MITLQIVIKITNSSKAICYTINIKWFSGVVITLFTQILLRVSHKLINNS